MPGERLPQVGVEGVLGGLRGRIVRGHCLQDM
jgi:hypothetical protein